MPIKKPGRVLLHHVPLQFVRNRVVGGGRKSVDSGIILVPFIDFLIVLVVFLLTSFGNQVIAQSQDDKLRLPDGVHTTALEEAPVVAINQLIVMFEGRKVADNAELNSTEETQPIEQLIRDLEVYQRNWEQIHPGEAYHSTVVVQADQNVDYRVIRKVMASTAAAMYANVAFAVNDKSQ